eukprot:TRINITY_DN6019_c0_g1_i1.p1 TRINITY_DN6019_c0_g1~~TRINITY_DN6019_c0_g1_i1.p1  ORF type:complete len:267 (+),score=17.94 TRINITY_DN6019_c0_g1_i1:58-801(+)
MCIRDRGMGMSENELITLRNVLQSHRKNNFTNPIRKSKGVCLGLTVSQELAYMLGSTGIEVKSKINEGSKFYFTIPVQPSVEEISNRDLRQRSRSNSESASSEDHICCDCRRILIVDDNAYNIMVLKTKLINKNFMVECASNGAEAISVFQVLVKLNEPCGKQVCSRVNMILMDVDMPVMNGIDATIQLRKMMRAKQVPSVPIVGCSAYDSSNDKTQGLKAGMSDYIAKPITEAKLNQLFKTYLMMV